MTKRILSIVLLFSIILILSNVVYSEIVVNKYKIEDDFILSSNNAIIQTCACSTFLDIVSVKNIGNNVASYMITSDSDNVILYPTSFTLNPNQQINLLSYVQVPCNAKDSDFNIKVVSNKGLEKVMTQLIDVEKCQNLLLSPIKTKANIEPCKNATYSFMINNTDGFTETYHFSLDSFSEYTLFTANPAVIDAMQSKVISFVINPDCKYNGLFNLTLTAKAEHNNLKAFMPILLNITPEYGFSLSGPEYIEACNEDYKEIEFSILNQANFENEYSITLEGPSWAKLSANKFSLEQNQMGKFNLELNPDETGSFDMQIIAKSKLGELEAVKNIQVVVEDCYDFNLYFVEDSICKDDEEIHLVLENKGKFDESFEIDLLAPDFIQLRNEFIDVDSGGSKEIKINIGENGKYDSYHLEAIARIPGKNFEEKTSVNLDIIPLNKCYKLSIKPSIKFVDYNKHDIEFTLKNTGLKYDRYYVSATKPNWIEFNDKSFFIDVNGEVVFSIESEPTEDVRGGIYKIIFNIESENGEYIYQKNFYLVVSNNNIIGKTLGGLYSCRFILLAIGTILLILLILIIIFVVRKKKVKREKRKKIRKNLRWIVPLFVIFILIMFVALFFCLDIKLPSIRLPESEEPIINETQKEEFDCSNYEGRDICDSPLYIKMKSGERYQMDLSEYFFDPDGDPLVYKSSNPDNINIDIDGSIVTIVPEATWTGYKEIVFTATDPEDNMVVSDIFVIDVYQQEKNFFQRLFRI
jgi:hypothetical protein